MLIGRHFDTLLSGDVMMIKLLLLVLLSVLLTVHQHCEARRPYVDHPTCPRSQNTTESGRPCLRKCQVQSDCRAHNRRCACDGVCGMTCVRRLRKKRCGSVRDIENGSWELMTLPSRRGYRVGSIIRYSCNEAYTLYGPEERVCQANGMWSDVSPSCHAVEIPSWSSTSNKTCQSPPVVPHGRHNASSGRTSFPLGTQLVYRCKRGYNMDGPFRIVCVDEGRWSNLQTTCSPRSCGHPGEIENGLRSGSVFTYEERVNYSCLPDFELVGRPYRVCLASGRWSGKLPTCRPIACQKLVDPDHGRVISDDDVPRFGSSVSFTCNPGYQLTTSPTRTCLPNGTWSGSAAVCKRMDCERLGFFPNGEYVGDMMNPMVGSRVQFRCIDDDMLFDGESHFTECLRDGTWSHPIPKCWSPCILPHIANGSIEEPHGKEPDTNVDHGSTLQYTCGKGFQAASSTVTCCHNGTWLTTPLCSPAACIQSEPPDINDGIVRIHHQQHNDRALYVCDFGFTMVGDGYVICQYGEWIKPSEDETECVPNTCDYPGNIENGKVLLVGHIGKYEYRQYVQPVDHNDHIQYECNKHYRLVGPPGSTCVNGTWSPPQLPICQPKRHQHLYYFYPNDQSFVGQLRRASVSPRPPFRDLV